MFSHVTGAEETTAVITAGIPVLTAMLTQVINSNASKNPYESTVDNGLTADIIESDKTAPDGDRETVAELEKIAATERKDGLPLDNGSSGEIALREAKRTSTDEIWGIPKPVFYIGAIALAVGGFYLYNKYVLKPE
jgi:hypothetical protein